MLLLIYTHLIHSSKSLVLAHLRRLDENVFYSERTDRAFSCCYVWLDCLLRLSWVKRRHSGLLWTLWGQKPPSHIKKPQSTCNLLFYSLFNIISPPNSVRRWDTRSVKQLQLCFKLLSLKKFEITADQNCSKTEESRSPSLCFSLEGLVLQRWAGIIAKTVMTPPSSGKST